MATVSPLDFCREGVDLIVVEEGIVPFRRDMVHAILPTRLPLSEFYAEYAELLQHALTPTQTFNLIRKFPLREIPALFRLSNYLMRRIPNAHNDYNIPDS